ncbi:phytanoyl-CoA dioxygenase, putative [Rhizoctonia solani AG-1 IA]|uniref:Phytanoyl-CoA dioxygenase, putative n=1 Tax=Thanatephorus cucumeris (strain AG1-IA) TaxID=983506 RepID=L8X7W0_THACA|nr:phytanoyl-CoA dioxygenase, putative [Rhizoctonia solani AG-1 IA]
MRAFLPQPRLFGLLHARKFATAVNTAPKLRSLTPSASERAAGRFGPANLLLALEALHQDGIVEITDVVNENHLDALNERMIPDAYTLRDMRESPYNYNRECTGNIQQDPPPEPSLFFRDIFLNPFALQVSNAVLGNRPKMTFCSGNTALKSTDRQPVHTDADFAQPSVEMTPENGSTELWLGTHAMANLDAQDGLHGERASGRIKPELIETRRNISPPFQPCVPKGSLLIRDLRLWHADFAPWYMNQMRLEFPKGMEGIIHHPDLELPADFVDGPINYLGRAFGNAYDFRQIQTDQWGH